MNSIYYKEDIIKELSEELNIPFKEIEEIVEINNKYIKKNILEKDYIQLSLPNLCTLRLNYRLAWSSCSYLKKSKTKSKIERLTSLERKIKILTDHRFSQARLVNFKKPIFERLYNKWKRVKGLKYIYRIMYEIIGDLEKRTNEILNEIK